LALTNCICLITNSGSRRGIGATGIGATGIGATGIGARALT